MGDQKTQEEKEKEASEGPAGIGGGILSMLASVGGMIPSLLKGPQQKELERMQRGGGAGAAMARQTASEAARRVVGASAAQPSSGRGGNLREGLRAADQIVQRGAEQAAVTGARESAFATQQLRANDLRRRGAFRTLGAGFGQGLAGIASTLAAAKDQGPVQPEEGLPGPTGYPDPNAPAGPQPAQGPLTEQDTIIGQGQQGLERLRAAREQAEGGVPIEQDGQMQPSSSVASPEQARSNVARQASPQAQEDRALTGLVEETAKKQQAELGYMSTASSPEAEAFRAARKKQEEWLYYQAMNYDPMAVGSLMGIDPVAAEKMLRDIGAEPDLARLGIEGGDEQRR